ncbi:MAG: Zn-ribbon domain-containing OB-fold protein [Dehalococcoidia bacterium]|nr:Zn-ribbon domain-containing OB-fold protein [Dehalococcoidia bacterium]
MEGKGYAETPLSIDYVADMPYSYHAGFYYSKFLRELRDNKRLVGVKCPACRKVYIPPRIVCRDCFVKMEEFVPVSDQGTLIAFTVTNFSYTDTTTGNPKPIPYTAAYIRLDGSDSNIVHRLDLTDETKIKSGVRVQAVFSENRTGDYFTDIDHFTIIKGDP